MGNLQLLNEIDCTASDSGESQDKQDRADGPRDHICLVDEIEEAPSPVGHAAPLSASIHNAVASGAVKLSQSSFRTATPAPQTYMRPISIKGDEAEGYREARGPEWRKAFYVLRDYRLTNLMHVEGDGNCLVDLMTREGVPISDGEMEMVYLTDEIMLALAPPAQSRATPSSPSPSTHSQRKGEI
ncbi:hypothetical protein ABK249_30330 [Neorhizobium sp. Rsf11]|uniref:Uncharacterized protein n=1 Tax=Neorhizobium phenanthreniclasticum TaxID=3157917 RepID=A0ABV0MBC7_9HYPH